MADSIFIRFRMMSGFWSSLATRLSEYLATFAGSKSLNARRYPSRLLRITSQLRPVWAPSRTRNSKCLRSCRDAPLMIVITYHQGLAGDGPGASRSRVVCACRPQDARAPVLLNLKGAIRRRDLLGIVGAHSR